MSDVTIVDFGSGPQKRPTPGMAYPHVWSRGFGAGPYPGPNGLVTCTQLDHSEYTESTNYWNALQWTGEKKACMKCGRPTYREWYAGIDWKSRDIEYWREVFRTAEDAERGLDGGLPFIYIWEPKGHGSPRVVHGDEDFDPNLESLKTAARMLFHPKSVLTLLERRDRFGWRKEHWARGHHRWTLIQSIRLQRYQKRLTSPKENHYLGFDSLLRMELEDMAEGRDCVDNYRFARVDIRKDMQRYRKQRDHGCCGSLDKEVSIMGKKFMIGYNFGH